MTRKCDETKRKRRPYRFIRLIRIDMNGCWNWTGSKDKDGYGRIHMQAGQSHVRTHRLSFQLFRGEIQSGLCVLHSCDNPSCVRPSHLFLGTNRDNVNDMLIKGRQLSGDRHPARLHPELWARGSRVGTAKLSESTVIEIKKDLLSGISERALERKYKISRRAIHRIHDGTGWRHVQFPIPTPGGRDE